MFGLFGGRYGWLIIVLIVGSSCVDCEWLWLTAGQLVLYDIDILGFVVVEWLLLWPGHFVELYLGCGKLSEVGVGWPLLGVNVYPHWCWRWAHGEMNIFPNVIV